jgi:hypothetical protein
MKRINLNGDIHISRLALSVFPVSKYSLSRYSCALSAAAPTDSFSDNAILVEFRTR